MLVKLLVTAVLAFCAVNALSPVSIKGAKLFDGQGKQFFLRGIDYTFNVPPQDVLANAKRCQVDAGLMKSIGINSIRVYGVDVKNDHSSCMNTFESQGIYVWIDMSTPDHAMNRLTPAWDMDLYTQFTKVIDEFSRYDNTLLFGVGNELLTDPKYSNTSIAYYLKAAARDMKEFQKKRGYRPIPLIYCDGKEGFNLSQQMSTYLACGDSRDTIDAYGINIYDWCNNSTYYSSGYDKLYGQFESLNIPVLFGETGCKPESGSRSFTGLSTILGPVFQNVFSGAVVYEWFNGQAGYGIVEYDDEHKSFPTTHEDFNKLSTVLATANPTGTSRAAYTTTNSAPTCPTADPDSDWLVDPKSPLPVIAGLNIDTVTARTTWTGNAEPTGATSGPDGASESNSSKSSASLSKGAIAGIAIGAVAGVLVIAGVIAWMWFKKRQQTKQGIASEKAPTLSDDGIGRPELPAQSVGYVLPRQEMPASTPKSPVAINQEPQELGGNSVHEIGGAQ